MLADRVKASSPCACLCRHVSSPHPRHMELLLHEDMPTWFQRLHGPTILVGYRPTQKPLRFYFHTLWSLHNETLNVWTHLIGAAVFIALLFAGSTRRDGYMIAYRGASAACFVASSSYHLFLPVSEEVYTRLQRLDYAAIFILIGASAIPYYSVQYKCHQSLELLAVLSTTVMMLVLAILVGTQPWFGRDTRQGKLLRVVAFSTFAVACTAFGGMAIFLAGFSPRPYITAEPGIAIGLGLVTVFYVAGPVVYAMGWPERRRPRAFDLIGASHQLMHVCVLAAALVNGFCMERTRALRSVVAPCVGDPGSLNMSPSHAGL